MKYLTLPACLLACVSICSAQEPVPAHKAVPVHKTVPTHKAAPAPAASKPAEETPEHKLAAYRYELISKRLADQESAVAAAQESLNQINKEVHAPEVWNDVSKLGPKMRESERALQTLEFRQGLVDKSRVEADVAKTRLDYVDQCGVLYTKTIDKRPSDLSIRDSDRVQACKGLNLYPPTITIE